MSTTLKDKRRYKVTLTDRKSGMKHTFEVHDLGMHVNLAPTRGDYTTASCVKMVMDYPLITTTKIKPKAKAKAKKKVKNGRK